MFEQIINLITRIAVALETLASKEPAASVAVAEIVKPTAAQVKAAKAAAEQAAKVATPEPELEADPIVEEVQEEEPVEEVDPLDAPAATTKLKEYTEDDVRVALKNYREVNGSPATMAVLKKAGATGMGDLAVDKYAEVMAVIR